MIIEQQKIIILIEEESTEYINEEKSTIWYFPKINTKTKSIEKLNIKNIEDLREVKNKVFEYYKEKYISNENISKPIINKDTHLKIEIWKSGINETFGNAKYYKNLTTKEKLIKLTTMDNLAKMIKHGKVRSNKASNYHNKNSSAEYYYLIHPIIIDNEKYMVNIDIRKVPNVSGRFYIHSVQTKRAEIPGN